MCFESLAQFQSKDPSKGNVDGQLLSQISQTRRRGNNITENFLSFLEEELQAKLNVSGNFSIKITLKVLSTLDIRSEEGNLEKGELG